MAKTLLEIASEIVHAQVATSKMSADDIQQSLIKTFAALQKMQRVEDQGGQLQVSFSSEEPASEKETSKAANPMDSIQNDKVICLECGVEMKQLTARHLQIHHLSPRDYKKKWGFSLAQPLSAKSLTKARSKAAKKRGIPEQLVEYMQRRRAEKSQLLPQESAPAPVVSDVAQEQETEKKPAGKRGRKPKVV